MNSYGYMDQLILVNTRLVNYVWYKILQSTDLYGCSPHLVSIPKNQHKTVGTLI